MGRSNKMAALVGLGFLVVAAVATVVVLITSSGGPAPVTRDDVLAHWAKMPEAVAAAPSDIDRDADRICARIREDSAAALIANAEQLDKANGGGDLFREHVRLMVSYKCPEFADEFK